MSYFSNIILPGSSFAFLLCMLHDTPVSSSLS